MKQKKQSDVAALLGYAGKYKGLTFLGLTLSILLIAGLVDWARLPYGLSHREAMGLFFESKGMFFLVMSNVALVQMVLQEAIPKGQRKPYLLLLVLPLALLLLV